MQSISKINNSPVQIAVDQKNKIFLRCCNLCSEKFHGTAFERFCHTCRESEELQFSDWLPDLEFDKYQKVSA